MKRHGKYNAKRTVVDGIRFDSKREAARYRELKLLEKAGEIRELTLQPEYKLDAYWLRPMTVGVYRADFRYREGNGGILVVEDVKGVKTPLYRWKRKHMLAQYGIAIRET